ncbi:MAG: hypothetical protein BGO41_12475 [Clostridiales bacterium 38-18]|nr:MAG: hypothetical protein BGO41_12475 [Clostridiales bacterium 38-18]
MLRKVIIGLLSIILLVMLVFTGLHERTVIIIEDIKTGEQRDFFPKDDQFILGYTHSVLLTPVEEYFEVDKNNNLILQKTIYESFGVGLPYEQDTDADFEIVDGKFILYLNRTFEQVNMIASPIPKHLIKVNGESTYIAAMFSKEDIDVTSDAFKALIKEDEEREKYTHDIKIYAIKKKVFEIGNYHVVL